MRATMYIFVDESGTFTAPSVRAPADSWCVVVAFVLPESAEGKLDAIVRQLRQDCGNGGEVKLAQVSEARYVRLLRDLSRIGGIAFAVAVDVSLHAAVDVAAHQRGQSAAIVEHRDKMLHEVMKRSLTELSESMASLPLQLYTQLQCQVELFHKVLTRAPLYFSQFKPEALTRFSWRIDRKDTIPTQYENTFRMILAASLQSKSLRDPMITLVEGDYQHLRRFEYPPGEQPDYLETEYGIKVKGDGLNLGQMIQEDFQLVDSDATPGVQIADLLASGIRRLFKGGFARSHEIALGLGANMVQEFRDTPIVRLMSLSTTAEVTDRTAHVLEVMERNAKPMLILSGRG